jgi:hypothetical protein
MWISINRKKNVSWKEKMAYNGRFRPTNPEKYRGDVTKIQWRSSWELKFFRYVDRHPDVIWWQSEELAIPYISPIDGKVHRYFPDVILKKRMGPDKYAILMIEIKPDKQTRGPDISKKNATPSGRISRRYLNEVKTFGINDAKWRAARKYCEERGWHFEIMTEKSLGIK